MRNYHHHHKHKKEKLIGLTLAIVGFLIFINSMPIRFLLLLIGVALLLMGALLFMK